MNGSEPTLLFSSSKEWRKWLEQNHGASSGIWMKISKKGSETPSASYSEALDEALCFGWIDGQKKPLDESFWLQRFVPRKPKGNWSKINIQHAERLIRNGSMHPAGLREVEKAKADGRWDAAYESQSSATVPDDLQAELDRNPRAAEFFGKLSSVNRYAILYRLQTAKRPETRTGRLAKFVEMLSKGETIHPQKG